MDNFARNCGAAAARGGYQSAAEADQIVAQTRRAIANVIGADDADCISFHANGTAALNAAIHGLLRPGDHVVTCAAEHNSVLRPLHYLQSQQQIQLTVVPVDSDGRVDATQLLDATTDETRMVALTHASNVTGAVQPIEQVGQGLQGRPALLLCDAAQTFGTLPIDVATVGIDLLAAPGHKASGGPLGSAFLYVARPHHQALVASIQGGTGSQSESLEMPAAMPTKLEAGNLNVPALAGWFEALRELTSSEIEARARDVEALSERLYYGLGAIDGVRLFGGEGALPIASLAIEGLSPTDLAAILDAEYGIETRAGMHCAALIHDDLGSSPEGTLRISAGHTTTGEEIDTVVKAIKSIAESMGA